MNHERQKEVFASLSKKMAYYQQVADRHAREYARTDNPSSKANYNTAMAQAAAIEEARNIFQDGRVPGRKLDT